MRLSRAVLAIVDISGYTGFIKRREVALLHAEQIIDELLNAMIDGAEHPLTLNKLEGDAALLFAETGGHAQATARDVLRQVAQLFHAFSARLDSLREARRHCSCDACANVGTLTLKAFLHEGELVVKQVRQFEELAGENVILIHRLLKNTVRSSEYVLLTEDFRALVGAGFPSARAHREQADGLGEVALWLLDPTPPTLAALAAL